MLIIAAFSWNNWANPTQTSIRTVSVPTQIRKSIFQIKTKMFTIWVARIIKGGPVRVVTVYHFSRIHLQWFKKTRGNFARQQCCLCNSPREAESCLHTYYCCISSDPTLAAVLRSPHKFSYQNFSSYQLCKIRNYGLTVVFSDWRAMQAFVTIDKLCQRLGGTVTDNKDLRTYTFFPYARKVGRNTCWFLWNSTVRKTPRNWDPPPKKSPYF